MAPQDRRCRPAGLSNPLRRWLAPPSGVLDLLGVGGSMQVVDLGAGPGYFARAALGRLAPGGRLYLVDPDASHLRRARAEIGTDPRVTVLESSGAQLGEIPTGSIDRLLASLVLCCLVDKEGVMHEAWRILRPGGRIYVSYPSRPLPRFRRRISLRVTPARWDSLLALHPWQFLGGRRGRLFTHHLLQKPPAVARPGAPGSPRSDQRGQIPIPVGE